MRESRSLAVSFNFCTPTSKEFGKECAVSSDRHGEAGIKWRDSKAHGILHLNCMLFIIASNVGSIREK